LKFTHNDETKAAESHSTQIASVEKLENAKVVLRDPRNIAATETRMRYEVTKAPSRSSCSFDKYSGRWIDNFPTKCHKKSTQSGLNSHKRYLGMSLHVSYDPRRKRLHKISVEPFDC